MEQYTIPIPIHVSVSHREPRIERFDTNMPVVTAVVVIIVQRLSAFRRHQIHFLEDFFLQVLPKTPDEESGTAPSMVKGQEKPKAILWWLNTFFASKISPTFTFFVHQKRIEPWHQRIERNQNVTVLYRYGLLVRYTTIIFPILALVVSVSYSWCLRWKLQLLQKVIAFATNAPHNVRIKCTHRYVQTQQTHKDNDISSMLKFPAFLHAQKRGFMCSFVCVCVCDGLGNRGGQILYGENKYRTEQVLLFFYCPSWTMRSIPFFSFFTTKLWIFILSLLSVSYLICVFSLFI